MEVVVSHVLTSFDVPERMLLGNGDGTFKRRRTFLLFVT
jgi:hypothetical protein